MTLSFDCSILVIELSSWSVHQRQRISSYLRQAYVLPMVCPALGGLPLSLSIAGNVNKLTLFSTTNARSAPSDCAPSDASGTETTGHGDPYRRRIASSRNRSRIKG